MSDSDSDSMPSLVGDSSSVPEDPDNEDTEDSDFANEILQLVDIWQNGTGKGKGKDQDQGKGNGKSKAQGGG